MWRETTKYERNAKIFREELDDFLPSEILDFHVHIFNEGVIPEGETYSCAGYPIAKYDFDDLRGDLAEIYPGRSTAAVCFGNPDISYDKQENDRYVAGNCDGERFFAFRLFDPLNDTPDGVAKDIAGHRFAGLKPYLNYVRKEDVNRVEIREMLPDWIMKLADDLSLVVMLHIPRSGRLADPKNQEQIIDMCKRYPKTQIVLAHAGRAYYLKNIVGHLDGFRNIPNLWFDLAMVNNWEVLEYLFRTARADRILYATDLPVSLAPGKSVEINDQYTYVTPVPWKLSICDERRKLVFTSFLYEELRAVRKAVERAGLGRSFVEGIFWDNGMRLLKSVKGDV